MTRILVIDNYDSFVYNLVQYAAQLGADCVVRRNDAVTVAELDTLAPDGVLISPGPGVPEAAGVSVAMVLGCATRQLPMLGVCLGHQALAVSYGARVGRAPELLHGKSSQVTHAGAGVLAGLPRPFTATRYHSLAVQPDSVSAELEVTAWSESGVIMALRHRELPLHGVQFHPESVLSQGGHTLLATWLAGCGSAAALQRAPALAAGVEALRLRG
ncbi:aminodeoxychorismate/anthranilate synthase component II [soil metagenome]